MTRHPRLSPRESFVRASALAVSKKRTFGNWTPGAQVSSDACPQCGSGLSKLRPTPILRCPKCRAYLGWCLSPASGGKGVKDDLRHV